MLASSTTLVALFALVSSLTCTIAAPLDSASRDLKIASPFQLKRQASTATASGSVRPSSTTAAPKPSGTGTGGSTSPASQADYDALLKLAGQAEVKLTFACGINSTVGPATGTTGTGLTVELAWSTQDFSGVKYVFVTDEQKDVTEMAILTKKSAGTGMFIMPPSVVGPLVTLGVANVTEPRDKLLANSICLMNVGGLKSSSSSNADLD